jgi:tripartite-type tricarboxylate transporter receptor subunit TctC
MVVNPSVSAKTVPEFTAYAKANPAKINLGSPGIGSSPHVAGELFKMMAGVDLVHVPYRGGGPVMTDLLGGQVQVLFGSTSLTIEQIRAGKLRPLAVTTATRWEVLLYGIGAPRNTQAEIIDTLNKEINAALADPNMKARIADLGGTVLTGSPTDFGKLIAEETDKWGKVIRAANIKPQ